MQKGWAAGCSWLRARVGFKFIAAIFVMITAGQADARIATAPIGTPTCYADAIAVGWIEVKWTDVEGETQFRVERLGATGWVEVHAAGGGSGNAMGGYYIGTRISSRGKPIPIA